MKDRPPAPRSLALLFARVEWLLLLAVVAVAAWAYPLRLQDAWLLAINRSLGDGGFGQWLWRIAEPFISFEYSPLLLRGVLATPLLLGFAALVALRRLLFPDGDDAGGSLRVRLALAAALGWILLSGFWSPTPDIARDAAIWTAIFGAPFYFLLLRGVSDRERKQLAVLLAVAGSGVLAILFLEALPVFRSRPSAADPAPVNWIYKVMYRFADSDRNLFGSLIGHNTAAASFIMLTCFPALALLFGARTRLGRWLAGAYLAAAIFGALLLQSRSIWALGPILGILAVRSAMRQAGLKASKGALTLVLAALAFGLATQTVNRPWNPFYSHDLTLRGRMNDLTPRGLELEARLRLDVIGVRLIPDRPLFGYGLYAYQYVYPRVQGEYFNLHPESRLNQTINRSNFAHNEYLQAAIDHGAIGLALLLWFAWEAARRGRTLRSEAGGDARLFREAFGWSSLGLALHALVDFPFHVPQLLLPGMLCIAAWATERKSVPAPAAQAVPLVEGSGFRPLVFARLLGTLLAIGAVPLASSYMFIALQADFFFNEGSAFLSAARQAETSKDYPYDEALNRLKAAEARVLRAGGMIPFEYQVPAKMIEVKLETGKIFRARAEKEGISSDPKEKADAAADRERAAKELKLALGWAEKTLKGLDYHFIYYLASLAEGELARVEPGAGHEQRRIYLLQKTLYYCPVFGEALWDLDSALSSIPGGDHGRVVALRRKIYKQNPDVWNRRYFFVANDWKRLGAYELDAKLWDQLLEVDPGNAEWLAEAADARLLSGDLARAREMLERMRTEDEAEYYRSGMMLADDALKRDWKKGLFDLRNVPPSAEPGHLAKMRAMELEFASRVPDGPPAARIVPPPQTTPADWERAVSEWLPEVRLGYFQDPAGAREAFDKRLQMEGPSPSTRFWLSGIRIGLAVRDGALARKSLDAVAVPGNDPRMFSELRSRVESAF